MMWNEMINHRRLKEAAFTELLERNRKNDIQRSAIENAIKQLSGLEQTVILLRLIYEMPIARVADHFGMSWNGADALIDQGFGKIRSPAGQARASYEQIHRNEVNL